MSLADSTTDCKRWKTPVRSVEAGSATAIRPVRSRNDQLAFTGSDATLTSRA